MSFGGWGPFRLKVTKADRLFSLYIRWRDKWTCQRCWWWADETDSEQRQMLHCSHFHGRINRGARFDPDNAAALCANCHRDLGDPLNRKEHEEFFLKRLGQARLDMLLVRAKSPRKVDEELICVWLCDELEKLGVDPKTGRKFPRALA